MTTSDFNRTAREQASHRGFKKIGLTTVKPLLDITIRNIDERTKRRLRLRAAKLNRSMEEEVRQILRSALAEESNPAGNLAEAIARRFRPLGGENVDTPRRRSGRPPPTFV